MVLVLIRFLYVPHQFIYSHMENILFIILFLFVESILWYDSKNKIVKTLNNRRRNLFSYNVVLSYLSQPNIQNLLCQKSKVTFPTFPSTVSVFRYRSELQKLVKHNTYVLFWSEGDSVHFYTSSLLTRTSFVRTFIHWIMIQFSLLLCLNFCMV